MITVISLTSLARLSLPWVEFVKVDTLDHVVFFPIKRIVRKSVVKATRFRVQTLQAPLNKRTGKLFLLAVFCELMKSSSIDDGHVNVTLTPS